MCRESAITILKQWEVEGKHILNVRTDVSKPYLSKRTGKMEVMGEKTPSVFGFNDKVTGEFKKSNKQYAVKKWETYDFKDKVNYDHDGFAFRLGKQDTGEWYGVLDFDNFGSVVCQGFCDEFYKMSDDSNGWYKTSTVGNMAVLFDYTNCQSLIDRLDGKVVCEGLEIMNNIGCQQVMPPTMTTCKREGKKVQAREWLCDQPIKYFFEGDANCLWLHSLLDKYQEKKISKTKKTAVVSPSSSDDEKPNKKLSKEQQKTVDLLEHIDINALAGKGYGWKIISALKGQCLKYSDIKHWADKSTGWDWSQKWNELTASSNNIGVLITILKKENPTGLKLWFDKYDPFKEVEKVLEDEYKMLWKSYHPKTNPRVCYTDNAMADAFKVLYGDKFVFCNGRMYHFNGVYWCKDNKTNSNLNQFIDATFYKDFRNYILKKISYYSSKVEDDETNDDDTVNKNIGFWNKLNGCLKDYLRSMRTKNELIKAIASKICNDKQQWDLNPYVFVFENCVFNLKTGLQDEPNPKDFMTTTCGWAYDFEYKNTNTITKLSQSIQKSQDQRDYLLKAYNTCLFGIQSRNVFILTGTGGNGKSVFDELLMSMLGSYGYVLPKALLTQPLKEGADPAIMLIHNKRAVIVSEPDASKNICCSVLKALSGDSKLSSRQLYGEIETINVVCTTIIECNTAPDVDEMNDGITDRLGEGVITFNQQFKKQSDYDMMDDEEKKNCIVGNEYYKSDEFRIAFRQEFFDLLLTYTDKVRIVPDSVKIASAFYLSNSDPFYSWFVTNYKKEEGTTVKVKELHTHFKSMCQNDWNKNQKIKYGGVRNFEDGLKKSVFLRKCIKDRTEYYNQEQLRGLTVCGWSEIPQEEECNDIGPSC